MRRSSQPLPGALALLLAATVLGCAIVGDRSASRRQLAFTPDELRSEIVRRAPELRPEDVLVPFAVDAETIEAARDFVRYEHDSVGRLRALTRFLTSPSGLALRYDRGSLGTAGQTLERGTGNCLSLASVLVGLARGLGWSAYYVEMTVEERELAVEADVAIAEQHMAALLSHRGAAVYVDYSGQLSRRSELEVVSDARATALYYINRAYATIRRAHLEATPVPWEETAQRFEIVTRIAPELPEAWNNLGVALARLERVESAARAYARAIELDADDDTASRNLARLRSRQARPSMP